MATRLFDSLGNIIIITEHLRRKHFARASSRRLRRMSCTTKRRITHATHPQHTITRARQHLSA